MPATRIDTRSAPAQARTPDPAIVRSGDGSSVMWNAVELAGGALQCGQWLGQPGELEVRPRPHHEMFTVLSGLVELVEPDGSLTRVGPGEAAFIPRGWTGLWRTVEETRKTYLLLTALPGEAV